MTSAPQFLAPAVMEEDDLEQSLRPRRLNEFVGQERIKEQLAISLDAAKGRDEALDHVLLVGPPGLGKTSLAFIVREELGVGIRCVAGPALERKGDMAAILTGLERHDVLFVDEIHRLNRAIEEILYPALEDFRLDIIVGQGAAARTLTLDLPPFTLVGATTRTGLLTTPLRDRFGMTFRLEYYEPKELGTIVRRSARILDVEIAEDAADEIARQLRLRNIGGLIISDFIDMKSRRDQQAVYNLMKERLTRDKARTHVLPISQLGLMEMTRQRAQESLSDTIYENCPYCGGRGVVKTSMTTSVELHRTLNTIMRKHQDSIHEIRVILNPDVLKRLKEEDEELLVELERRYAGRLMFRGDATFHHEKFVITDANTGAELKP